MYANPRCQSEYFRKALSINISDDEWNKWYEIKATRDIIVHNLGIINETYIEIKNFPRKEVDIKAEAVVKQGKEIKVLYYKDLEEMMNYIDSKYNTWHTKRDNNYHTLYDIRT